MRTLSSKRVYTLFVRTLVILLERYLVLHIFCVTTLHNHFSTTFVLRKGDVTVVLYCLLLVQSQIALWDNANTMLSPSDQLTN